MLKSVVPSFCSVAFIIGLPSAANPGRSVSRPERKAHHITVSDKQGMEFVGRYIKNNDESLTRVKERSQTPFAIIDSVLSKYKLPLELKYLAVIESELKPTARSRVGAKGPWQLMPETAHELGLKVNRKADERVNFYKSTRAAALYLRDLHHQFGDWLLVLAAYNGGPVPVYRAINKSHSRNFWTLQRYLPAESRWHVKKFIATAYYFEAEGYGVTGPVMQKAAPVNPVSPVGFPESENDRFHRLMEESAKSLQTSRELLEN